MSIQKLKVYTNMTFDDPWMTMEIQCTFKIASKWQLYPQSFKAI